MKYPIDSREYARLRGIQHPSLIRTMYTHMVVSGLDRISSPSTGGRPTEYYMLSKANVDKLLSHVRTPQKVKDTFYILYNEATSLYKLGVTSNFERRRRTLEMQCGIELRDTILEELKDPYGLESSVRAKYVEQLRIGKWYSFSETDIEGIEKVIEKKQRENN